MTIIYIIMKLFDKDNNNNDNKNVENCDNIDNKNLIKEQCIIHMIIYNKDNENKTLVWFGKLRSALRDAL